MRLFITGAAGRLGHRVVAQLAAGHEIVAFDRAAPPESMPDSVRYVQADLLDADQVRKSADGAEAIVHLGAIPGPLKTVSRSDLFAINVQGTYNVLEAARCANVQTVILASSLCAIGFPKSLENHNLTYLPVDEDHPCRPGATYDLTKRINELTASAFHRETGIPTVCFRFPALVDVRNAPWFPGEICREPPRLVLGDYLDFADAIAVIATALDRADLRYEVLFAHAETLGRCEPTPEYIRRFKPAVAWRGDPPTETTPLINTARLKRTLNFTPAVTWQQGMAHPPEARTE